MKSEDSLNSVSPLLVLGLKCGFPYDVPRGSFIYMYLAWYFRVPFRPGISCLSPGLQTLIRSGFFCFLCLFFCNSY